MRMRLISCAAPPHSVVGMKNGRRFKAPCPIAFVVSVIAVTAFCFTPSFWYALAVLLLIYGGYRADFALADRFGKSGPPARESLEP